MTQPEAVVGEVRRVPGHVELPTTARESGGGEFDQAVVLRMFAARRAAILACYERALITSPRLAGTMNVSMMIEEQGTVARVRAQGSSGLAPDMDGCVQHVVERFRFNPGPEGGAVSYELTLGFSPVD